MKIPTQMLTTEAIDAALVAHGHWKQHLQDATAAGWSEFSPDDIKRDDICQFGRWLYSLPPEVKGSKDFVHVKELHAEFHRIAGNILALAIAGQRDEALKMLAPGGGYGGVSGRLVIALENWKSRI
jgi:hypothetical protein